VQSWTQEKHDVEEAVYGFVREYGGTVSAEHGIGTLKQRWLPYARSPEQIAVVPRSRRRWIQKHPEPWQGYLGGMAP
jgi:FAD/FMN-containing dehydrogenase